MYADIPSDIASLQALVAELRYENKDLREQLALFKAMKFSPKSEKVSSEQLGLFNEAEREAGANGGTENDDPVGTDAETEDDDTIHVPAHDRKRGGRKPLPANLPREVVVIELENKFCPHDGHPLKEIGQEVSEKLEIIPAKLKVIQTIRKTYCCEICEKINTAPSPSAILAKSYATPSLIAFIVATKYIDGTPLYRMEAVFKRFGIDLPRQTMARWMMEVAEMLMPLKTILREELLSSNYLNYDETVVQVLNEEGRKATSKSYIWVVARDGPKPITLFDYDPSRSQEVANSLLEGFQGYLQVDGYSGYNEICHRPGVIRLGCWAHSRRYFKNAFDHGISKTEGKQGLIFIKKLYAIEDKIQDLTAEEKKNIRQEKSVPVMAEFKKWLDERLLKALPKGLAAKAINYTLNAWDTLQVYLTDGNLKIDNTYVERKIRPFAIGRKNWLFSDTPRGAHASALFYSLIESAKANGLDPFAYIQNILEKIIHAKTAEDYYALLPFPLD